MSDDRDPLLGRTLDGRYQLEDRIGRGGMGNVYRGLHLMMNQRVAVKVLRPDLAHDEAATRRFAREARGCFRLDHPNSVRVYDFGFDAATDVMYLVMEYVDGRTVGDELYVDGPMSGPRAAHVMAQVCAVLDQAHGLGIVHRDLKPDNVMLLRRGDDADFVKVLDFGLAKLYEPDSAGTTMFSMAAVTQEGTVFGTPEYMSPEQATGQPLDPRSDLYSAGVVLYEMVTGTLPFTGGNFMAILSQQVKQPPVPPSQRRPELAIDPQLEALILRCMAKRPDQRPSSARELAGELDRLASQMRARPSRLPKAVAASETVDLAQSQLAAADREALQAAVLSRELATEQVIAATRKRSPMWWLAIAGAGALVVAVVLAVALSGGGDEELAGVPPSAAQRLTSAKPAAAPIDAAVAPAPIPADAAVATVSVDAALPDAASRVVARPPDRSRADLRRKVRAHLTAAANFRRSGNRLREIVELDAALKLDRRNREAAYQLGEALIASGDRARGCKYLRRARGLARAADAARRAGCSD